MIQLRALAPLVAAGLTLLVPYTSAAEERPSTACAEHADLQARADRAFIAGDDAEASQLYAELARLCPEHAGAANLARMTLARAGREGAQAGRLELIAFQSVFGALEGGLFGGSLSLGSPLFLISTILEGVGRGIASALWSADGISHGSALAVNAGFFWGHVYAVFLAEAIARPTIYPGALGLAGGLVGTAIGMALSFRQPSTGQVAFMNTCAIWSAVMALSVLGMSAQRDADWKLAFGVAGAASGAALFASAWLAPRLEITRGQALLLDAGALIGMLAGLGVGNAIGLTPRRDGFVAGLPMAAFTAAGMAAMGLGIHQFRLRTTVPDAALVPIAGESTGLALVGRF